MGYGSSGKLIYPLYLKTKDVRMLHTSKCVCETYRLDLSTVSAPPGEAGATLK